MRINVTTRHGHIGESTRDKIIAKVERLSRYFERLTVIDVLVDLEHPETPAVELKVSAEHKHDFLASESSEDLMRSVDGVVQKLEQQLRKYKEKIQERHRLPGTRLPGAPAEE